MNAANLIEEIKGKRRNLLKALLWTIIFSLIFFIVSFLLDQIVLKRINYTSGILEYIVIIFFLLFLMSIFTAVMILFGLLITLLEMKIGRMMREWKWMWISTLTADVLSAAFCVIRLVYFHYHPSNSFFNLDGLLEMVWLMMATPAITLLFIVFFVIDWKKKKTSVR